MTSDKSSGKIPKLSPTRNEDGNYNIIFITTDQEHYFEEYPEESNYRARQLLQEMGTSFEKHYICSNMSTSSRSVMYTGKHITDTKMIDNTDFPWQGALDESMTTIGDRLREAGYYTGYKGKWHMGDSSILEETHSTLTDLEGYGFSDWGGKDYIGSLREGYEVDPIIASEAIDWLDSTGRRRNEAGQSFFLAINMVNPHDIMEYDTTGYKSAFLELGGAPEDDVYRRTYEQPTSVSWSLDLDGAEIPQAIRTYNRKWTLQAGPIKREADWKNYQDYYFNCIQDSDNNLLKILSYLKDEGFFSNSIVVFTSDHGEAHGSHGLKGKGGFLYENNVHVPLVIVHPEYAGGKAVSALSSHLDLASTFVSMTNAEAATKSRLLQDLPGHNLMDLMSEPEKSVRNGALFCYEMLSMASFEISPDENGGMAFTVDQSARGMVRGLVTDRYKYVRYFSAFNFNMPETLEEIFENNDVQLFDLQNDPEEMVNLAADPQAHDRLILSLNSQLNQLIRDEIGEDSGQEVKDCLSRLA